MMAHSTIYNKEIDLDLAQRIIRKVVKSETKVITIENIIEVVCKHIGIDTTAIHTKSSKREIVQVRQIAMYLAKKHTDSSSSKIGQLIGGKDHATVLHACKIVRDQCDVDKSLKADIQSIETSLRKK